MIKENTLLLDMDMCCVDWEGPGSLLHEIWKKNFPELEFLGSKRSAFWNISDNYPGEYAELVSEIYKNPIPGFYSSMPVMKGFLEVLPQLAELGHIAIVSNPIVRSLFNQEDEKERKQFAHNYSQVSKEKVLWIEEHIAPVLKRMPETIFVDDKSHANGSVLFDDNPHVTSKVSMRPTWKHIMYTGEDEGFLFNKHVEHEYKTSWGNPNIIELTLQAIADSKKK